MSFMNLHLTKMYTDTGNGIFVDFRVPNDNSFYTYPIFRRSTVLSIPIKQARGDCFDYTEIES